MRTRDSGGNSRAASAARSANVDPVPAGPVRPRFAGRLKDDAELFAEPPRNNAPRQAVQYNKPVRQFHRAQRRLGLGTDVMVDIGAAELKNERPRRIADLEAAYRVGAAPRMNGDHRIEALVSIVGRDNHVMAEPSQNARPAQRRDRIAGACTRPWRSDKNYLHE
jgi:hypothetical protein